MLMRFKKPQNTRSRVMDSIICIGVTQAMLLGKDRPFCHSLTLLKKRMNTALINATPPQPQDLFTARISAGCLKK